VIFDQIGREVVAIVEHDRAVQVLERKAAVAGTKCRPFVIDKVDDLLQLVAKERPL
jgi:hypothetical protein